MATVISPSIIAEYRASLRAFAEALQEGSPLAEGFSLETIRKTYIVKFSDDLVAKGVNKHTAKSIAKHQAEAVLADVLIEIN